MNKKLTPLEALEKLNHTICLNINNKTLTFGIDKYDDCDCKDIYEFSKCYDIIETALKELEEYKKCIDLKEAQFISTHNMSVVDTETFNQLAKNSQALEIIKRNRYGAIQCLNYGCYEDYMVWHKCYLNVEPPLTQEEFNLLKGVLL